MTVRVLAGTLWVVVAVGAVTQPDMVAVTVLVDGKAAVSGTLKVVSKEPVESGRTVFKVVPA